MIVITGGAGFIGSNLISKLKDLSKEIIVVDDLNDENWKNLVGLNFHTLYNKKEFLNLIRTWGKTTNIDISFIIHLGATTPTIDNDVNSIIKNNYSYSMELLHFCNLNNIRLIYASSAATYGSSSNFSDDPLIIPTLKPLNPYALSKHLFDMHILNSNNKNAIGLKLFNVYGPNENHKGIMKSFINRAYNKIKDQGYISLYKSTNPNIDYGDQCRDFIHVNDVCDIIIFFMSIYKGGIFNVGTGVSCTFNNLVKYIFEALDITSDITYMDAPPEIAKQYQNMTKADITRLRKCGYDNSFKSIEEGVNEYIRYLEDRTNR